MFNTLSEILDSIIGIVISITARKKINKNRRKIKEMNKILRRKKLCLSDVRLNEARIGTDGFNKDDLLDILSLAPRGNQSPSVVGRVRGIINCHPLKKKKEMCYYLNKISFKYNKRFTK